jgi:LacI family transcriptional regulator, galactose operon repressor
MVGPPEYSTGVPTTLKELARLAGVHSSTVSRVINDPAFPIASETRARVMALVRATEYRPHSLARGLKLKRLHLLAMLVPDLTNPAFAAIAQGVEEGGATQGFSLILTNTGQSKEKELAQLKILSGGRTDGVILAGSVFGDANVEWVRQQEIPCVLVNRYSSDRDVFVGVDDIVGSGMATHHLINLGHTRIAHLAGSLNASSAIDRRQGYRLELERAGIKASPELEIETDWLESGGRRAMSMLLELRKPPTGVVCVSDRVAAGALEAIAERGLRVPEDISVVGFNDIPVASYVHPKLTTIRVPFPLIGKIAAEKLISQIEDGVPATPEHVLVAPELIIRASSGLCRVRHHVSG